MDTLCDAPPTEAVLAINRASKRGSAVTVTVRDSPGFSSTRSNPRRRMRFSGVPWATKVRLRRHAAEKAEGTPGVFIAC
jgi:hypothetical protein